MARIDDILAMDDAGKRIVVTPEWGGMGILVASMTAAERAEIEKRWSGKKASGDPAGFRIDVLSACLKQEDGSPLGTHEQVAKLMGKNSKTVERLFLAACEVSGLTEEQVGELEKN